MDRGEDGVNRKRPRRLPRIYGTKFLYNYFGKGMVIF
jgi:hypothetical protein